MINPTLRPSVATDVQVERVTQRSFMMQVFFESSAPGGESVRQQAQERMRFVTRRLRPFISWARIRVSDLNGPRGGVDKRCRIELKTEHQGRVVIESVATDWTAALALALGRVQRVVVRAQQRRQVQRQRLVMPTPG